MTTSENNTYSRPLVKRTLYGLFLVVGVLIALFIMASLGLFMVESMTGEQLKQMNESIRSFGFWTQFIRWALYLLLYIFWKNIITFWGRVRGWDDVVIKRALKSRVSTFLILFAVELFLIQSIHVSIYTFLMR
jgi:uncharacterized BrkB/YihY/UPF0761 family membrane protein